MLDYAKKIKEYRERKFLMLVTFLYIDGKQDDLNQTWKPKRNLSLFTEIGMKIHD